MHAAAGTPSATTPPSGTTPPRIGFLGPAGTFSEQVILRQPDLAAGERVPYALMTDVLFAVAEGELDLGVVPVENAIEGTVNAIVDTMAFDVDVLIQREMLELVSLNLLTRPGAQLEQVKRLLAIPVASAQCRTWLRQHLPQVDYVAANSNAEAAELAAAAADPAVAAIANTLSGELYGLVPAATDIEDHPENATRFVLVAKAGVPAPTGHDKTSIVVYQRADRPGSLLAILQEFAARSINLSLLLSRPTKTSLGDYCFLLDLDGHISDPVVADCLRNLRAKQADVKFLGSYPAAGEAGPATRAQSSSDVASAEAWLRTYTDQISG
jgi:prephenate dehydratase